MTDPRVTCDDCPHVDHEIDNAADAARCRLRLRRLIRAHRRNEVLDAVVDQILAEDAGLLRLLADD
jgi:hypothetical protein